MTRPKANRPTIEVVHRHIVNGNFLQAIDAMKEHSVADFFAEYDAFLEFNGYPLTWYVKAAKLYHGQKKRVRHGG